MWTKAQLATYQKVLAGSAKRLPQLEHLAEMARYAPQFADRVAELAIRAANLKNLAEYALTQSTMPVD